MKKDPKVTKYIQGSAPFAKPILIQLRKLMHSSCPKAEETMKWSQPFFLYNGKIIGGMGAFKAHCKFWIWNRKSVAAAKGEAAAELMTKLFHIDGPKDLPTATQFKSLIQSAMVFNEDGAKKIPRSTPKKRPPLKTPPALMKALKAAPKALEKYKGLAPSNQRSYSEWILSAKTEATLDKRLKLAVKSIAAGKKRYWD